MRSNSALVGVAAAVAVIALLLGAWVARDQMKGDSTPIAVAPEAQQPADTADAPAAAESAAEGVQPQPGRAVTDAASGAASEPGLTPAPSIDEVRLEPDGLTIIAGRAQPGSTVRVLLDGEENTSVTADTRGAFAAVTSITPGDAARVLSLVQENGEARTLSAEEVILAPMSRAARDASGEGSGATAGGAPAPEAAITAEQDASDGPGPSAEVSPAQQAQADAGRAEEAAEGAEAARADEAPPTEQVAVLKSAPEGVELLNRAPEVMDNVAIDTISYSQAGEVQLAGRAQSQAEAVRVYLDNAPVVTLRVDPNGRWRGDLPQVDTGVYELRVDEVDNQGTVTSRIVTPFKREDPAALATAGAPASGAQRVIVQTGDTLWAISRDRYGEGLLYVRVFEANRAAIRDPDLIYPGQVFTLPN